MWNGQAARRAALVVHRYVGLVMAVFLLVAGLTGSLLAFNDELDAWISPALMRVSAPADGKYLDPFEVTARVQAQLPKGQTHQAVGFNPEPGRAMSAWLEVKPDQWREVFVDPYTGAILGSRDWGNLSEGIKNLMPFIYRLHYSLALDDVGTVLFGIVALLWTIDCFVGAYLTFPAARQRAVSSRSKPWISRWLPMWLVRTNKLFGLVFTWHRASGLWVWAMLLVFAWSAVGFNLNAVYEPVMGTVTGMGKSGHGLLPELTPPFPKPKLSLREAHVVGQGLMQAQADQRGFRVYEDKWLYYAEDHGAFVYGVHSDLDLNAKHPRTEVYFDGQTGELIAFDAPSGISTGNTISSWLFALHMGAVGGLAYRIAVMLMGFAVTALSVTGVWIWWRKRGKRGVRADDAAALSD